MNGGGIRGGDGKRVWLFFMLEFDAVYLKDVREGCNGCGSYV